MPQAELDDEGVAAIATLVALAAKIEVARSGVEPQSSDQGSESVASNMPQHIYDPLAADLGASATTNSAIVEDVLPASVEATAMREPSRLGDALRSHYPEMCLLLMAVALIGAWAYASTPRTPESLPGPAIAEIRPDEAVTPPAPPAPEDTRLKFMGSQSCGDKACEPLLTLAPSLATTSPTTPAAAALPTPPPRSRKRLGRALKRRPRLQRRRSRGWLPSRTSRPRSLRRPATRHLKPNGSKPNRLQPSLSRQSRPEPSRPWPLRSRPRLNRLRPSLARQNQSDPNRPWP